MITVTLEQEELAVEPGGTVKIQVVVANTGDAAGRYALEVEGLDLEWCAIPVPAFTLQPGEETRERVLVKPPRSSESRAGVYPFVLSVKSLESGEKVSRQGSVTVKPLNLLTIELAPKRGDISPFSRSAQFRTIVANLGNTEQHVQLFASDPEDGCTYQYYEERKTLPAGGQAEVGLAAMATSLPIISSPRLYGFSVSARSVENSHVSATAQGQIERKGMLSPSVLISLVVIAVLVLVGWYVWPRPSQITRFTVDSETVTEGEEVTVTWTANNAAMIQLEYDGKVLESNLKPSGSFTFAPPKTGKLEIVAEGKMGQSRLDKTITVNSPQEAPMPEIKEFTVNPKRVKKGQPTTITYAVEKAVRIFITPLDIQLEPFLHSKDIVFPRSGKYDFVAVNSDNKTVTKSFMIQVDDSDAEIAKFAADPPTLPTDGGKVTLSWEIRGATQASIDSDVGSISPESGSMEVDVTKTTTFTLTALDSQGRPTTKLVRVVVASPAGDGGIK
jgi:hypothetical protein